MSVLGFGPSRALVIASNWLTMTLVELRNLGVKILDGLGMNYTKRLLCMIAVVAALAGLPARAQTPFVASPSPTLASPDASATNGTDPADTILTIKKRVDEVNVLFIATDHHGKFVRNLSQGDFTFLDDHKPPQSIINFRHETDLPLELGLLVDTSGSVHSRFDFEQEAAVSFLQHTLRANFDQAFVMGFSSHSSGHARLHRQCQTPRNRREKSSQWRRDGALRRNLPRLPREAGQGTFRSPSAASHHCGERRRRQSERSHTRARN